MLSNIGRAAIRRVGAGANASSTNRALQSGWLLRLDASKYTDNTFHNQFVLLARQYATASKATQTRKPRANAAAKPGPKPKSKLKKAPKAPAKKAPKKKVVKKVAKKTVKKVVKKKKVLTPEQRERLRIRELKKVALSPPTRKAESAWMVLLEESRATAAPGEKKATMTNTSAKYKSLSAEQLQELNHRASQNRVANNIAYKQWIEIHSPDQIRLANNARLALKKAKSNHSHSALIDERLPKQAKSAWTFFFTEKFAAGEFKHVKATEAMQLAARDFSGLSGPEKKKYFDLQAADTTRYITEFRTVYKRDPPSVAAAAAKA